VTRPLTIGLVGTVGVLALYLLVPGFQFLELVLLLIVVGFCAVGYHQCIVRGITTVVMLYIATGTAATFYRALAPHVGTVRWLVQLTLTRNLLRGDLSPSFSENVNRDNLAISFGLLAVVIWVALEAAVRNSFPDTRLPSLGILDHVGGVIVHLVVGALVVSLLFNTIGYGTLRRVHNQALLRPAFNQVLAVHYAAQSFWFPGRSPPIYVYDLDLSRER
jgi:hypothetical protein